MQRQSRTRNHTWVAAWALCAAVFTTSANADAARKAVELRVYPPAVSLTTSRDRQSVIAQLVYDDGITEDVTDRVQWSLSDATLVRQEGNVFRPAKDGRTELIVRVEGFEKRIPVTVTKAGEDRPISFRLDVMPVFMKAGCNTGSCHGAARGKDGFRLSLFGFDPEGDYYRITREIAGRRINLADPEHSLLLEKAVGSVPHTGGKRFDKSSEMYRTLLRWHEAGAPNDQGAVPTVDKVELFPPEAVLNGRGATQRLNVLAHYSDGTTRDVTSLAYFMSNNDNSAEVDQKGVVTAAERGEAFIMARFETHTVGVPFIVVPKDQQYTDPKTPEFNYIDTLVHQKLKKLRIVPSEVCSDEVFLRRAYLDIVGVLPTVEEYQRFMQDGDPNKRERLVDELLERKEFVELWVMKWAELLQIRTIPNRVDYKPMLLFYNWLQQRIAANMPMDQLVRELLSANGGTFSNPATNYYQAEPNTLKIAENVAQVFMGMRIQCAQCHNHPFDRWTMDDYYGFAAFFSQIGRKRGEDPRETIIFNRGSGEVRHPVGNRVVAPKFLGGAVPDVKGKDRRTVLANWLASPENPYFAKNLANIVWAHFMGRGIIDPVDDVRVSNPPVNGPLLEELGRRFTAYNYDFKKLVRDICTSRTYQLSTQTNETNASDLTNFSHATLRRIRAEVLLDAITQVTETKNKFRGLPLGARAVQIADGRTSTYFLTTFGRAKRDTPCSCEVKVEPNLSQALHLLNGDTVNARIVQGGLVRRRVKEGKSAQEIITELYIRCLSRQPTAKELARLNALLKEEADPVGVLEDIFWALLNSREFLFIH
ncbi:MAG: DUF1549 domain-containing protein [Planctomycetota bacterium]|nr:MAG: DUF1549 domain-containing protein [Planctomycetota bacterium]